MESATTLTLPAQGGYSDIFIHTLARVNFRGHLFLISIFWGFSGKINFLGV